MKAIGVNQLKVLGMIGIVCLCGCSHHHYSNTERNAFISSFVGRSKVSNPNDVLGSPFLDKTISLDEAWLLAIEHNKRYQAALENKAIAQGNILCARSEMLPSISLAAKYKRHDDDAKNHMKRASLDEHSTGLRISQAIYSGGVTKARIQQAKLDAISQELNVTKEREKLFYQIGLSYHRVLLAQELLQVAKDALRSANAYLGEVSKKNKLGSATKYSVIRAEVEVSLYQAQEIQAQNELDLAQAELLKEMGIKQESNIRLSDHLAFQKEEIDHIELLKVAYQNRPDLKQAELNVKLNEESIRETRGLYNPQLNAYAETGWMKPNSYDYHRNEWDANSSVGASISLPVFDGFKRKGELIKTKALLRKSELHLKEVEEQVSLDVKQAVLNLQNAISFVESQSKNLDKAKEGLRLAEAGYRQGINTEIDVTDARATLTRAKGLHYQAMQSYAIARLALEKSCGTLGSDFASNSNFDGKST